MATDRGHKPRWDDTLGGAHHLRDDKAEWRREGSADPQSQGRWELSVHLPWQKKKHGSYSGQSPTLGNIA
eukprot:11527438-Heterocapsa_arctica.AAC.1